MNFDDLKKDLLLERANTTPTIQLGKVKCYLWPLTSLEHLMAEGIARDYAQRDTIEETGLDWQSRWESLIKSTKGTIEDTLKGIGMELPENETGFIIISRVMECLGNFRLLASLRDESGVIAFSAEELMDIYEIKRNDRNFFQEINDKLNGQDDPNLVAASNGQDMSTKKAATQ